MYIYIKFQLSNKSIFIVIIAILLEFGNINNDEKEESDDVCWTFQMIRNSFWQFDSRYIQLVRLIDKEIVSHCILLLHPILVIFDTDYLSNRETAIATDFSYSFSRMKT